MILGMVGILVLIDVNVLKFTLIISQNIWIFIEKEDGVHDQVVEIHRLAALELRFIAFVNLGDNFCVEVVGVFGIALCCNEVIFAIRNGA